ncbi:hypothetical protein PF008_g6843 [Phytophthora fragariae]|uniref:Uncharacterized protein n=1 Tax=Phytophthora fragariae TaxID=53985 RepID=A0A6G0S4D2_9STRA|nr:hypothetical protein PF008_g6843 [Phytophthora fragariae]
MEARAKVKVRGSAGCELLRHFESVDPRAAEGLRREKPSDVPADLDVLLEEETRRSITDAYQRLLFEVKVLHRKGNFKSSQGDVIVQRVRDVASGGKTVLDLSGFLIFDEFVELLVPYLRSKTCRLAALNLSRTSLGVQAAIDIARATNGALQTLQFSDCPIPVESIRAQAADKGGVDLSGRDFNHLDAAAIGVLIERERKKIQKVNLSGNLLTGPKANSFHGITTIFESLKTCRQLTELDLGAANLRSDGLVAFANVIHEFPLLEKLDLSRNGLAHNSTNEKRLSGLESLCNALWRVKTLRELSLVGNYLDYLCSVHIAEMLKGNCTIVSLTLAQNPLGDAGAVDVSAALKKNATLLSLDLTDCQLSCEGMIEIAAVLRKFNSTLRTLNVTDNPDIRSQGYRSLVKSLASNHKITNVILNPGSKYERYVNRAKELLAVNALLNAVQTDAKRFAGFPALSEPQRTNFVDKLERFSESELRQLHEESIVENAAKFFDEKEAAGLSTLRHYAAIEQYAPLKRLLWCFEEELKPKNERRPIPKTPPGIGEGGGGMTRQEVEALNEAAQEAYNVHGMETCEFCGRTFAEGRLAIHNKSCRADTVAKKVADGAAPRNKKEPEVDYGRAKPSRPRLDSASSQSSLQSDSGGGESGSPPRTASGTGSRPLAGSLASNRKKIPGQEAARQRIQSPLEQRVDTESLKQELQGKESMVSIIQAKLDHWEASTMATLQEIRDLKDVFAQINTS